MSKKRIVQVGEQFNKLKIAYETEPYQQPSGQKKRAFVCKCECGNELKVSLTHLITNHTVSCGCHKYNLIRQNQPQRKHGHTTNAGYRSPEYISWRCMKDRCLYETSQNYSSYGGRGISVCDRWLKSFNNFLEDMGNRPRGFTLDRINPDGNYEPNNCRWADKKTQRQNQRVVDKKNKKDISI